MGYTDAVIKALAEISGVPVVKAADLIAATGDTGAFADISGILKRIAVKLSKISNDLRLLSSGPQAGVADIKLPARQAGSSIMPGKVNPVIPEVMNQVCFEVIGNDAAITMAVEAGQLQAQRFRAADGLGPAQEPEPPEQRLQDAADQLCGRHCGQRGPAGCPHCRVGDAGDGAEPADRL